MNTSLFIEYIDKYFSKVIGQITEKYNGEGKEQTLHHKSMLSEEYSADLNWGATALDHSIVAADVVALDSSLPLKSRSKITNATGKIPKLGVKLRKGEKLISDINVMKARGAEESVIAAKIFDDTTQAIKSMDVRKEIMFQQALSTGACLVDSDDNTGTGIRADFGYLEANQFKTIGGKWGSDNALPQDDVQQLFDKAAEDSNTISHVYLSKKYFDLFRHSVQGKLLVANYNNVVITDKNLLPVPSRSSFNEALNDEYGATFHVIDGVFKVEKADGSKESIRPWAEANIVGVPSENVGRLVYGTLAEETNPVEGVSYQKSGSHVLVSKYSKTDPLEEFTAAQALCIPVIDGADSIYLLKADEKGITLTPEALTFPKSASTKTVTVNDDDADGLTAETSAEWLTATVSGSAVTVTAAANTGTERAASVTLENSKGYKAIVTVTQATGVTSSE